MIKKTYNNNILDKEINNNSDEKELNIKTKISNENHKIGEKLDFNLNKFLTFFLLAEIFILLLYKA